VPEGSAPGSRPDDDDVVVLTICHARISRRRNGDVDLPPQPVAKTLFRWASGVITRAG
jgi:hypothetical protein